METIDTIITNWTTLSNTPIDWSLDAGPIWLVGMMIGVAIIMIAAWVSEARKDRQVVRQAIYRQAHAKANIRLNRMDRQGFQETV